MFADRHDAGRRLAARLKAYKGKPGVVVLGLVRGGMPVAFEVAAALGAPLGMVLVRKIGVPGNPELALGAVVDGADPVLVLNEDMARMAEVPPGYLAAEEARELAEIERRRALYGKGRALPEVRGKTAIVVDDGIATGATAKAALQGLFRQRVGKVVLAVPVAAADTLPELERIADDVVCLEAPHAMGGVGAYYKDFAQVSDGEVVALLAKAGA